MVILIFKGMGLVQMSFLLGFSLSLRDGNRTVTSHVGYNKDPQNGLVMPIRLGGAIPQETQPPKVFFRCSARLPLCVLVDVFQRPLEK